MNFSPDDPCDTCDHGWHGEPCNLRVWAGPGSHLNHRANPNCPCPGAFGALAKKEAASA